MINTNNRVLTIAGSDSGGGAGIQADLKTFSALGCFGMSVVTALTAQNTIGVQGIQRIPPEFVKMQMDSVLGDFGADAVKTGMLFSADMIQIVSSTLRQYGTKNIVVDPVMYAKSGDLLIEEASVKVLRDRLVPLAHVLTPNLAEASKLLNKTLKSPEEIEKAARDLSDLGPMAVIIKDGNSSDDSSDDCVFIKDLNGKGQIFWLHQKCVETKNTHGTGCTFSSAIAAFLAKSFSLDMAFRQAKKYITGAIQSSKDWKLGRGRGPVDHFF